MERQNTNKVAQADKQYKEQRSTHKQVQDKIKRRAILKDTMKIYNEQIEIKTKVET